MFSNMILKRFFPGNDLKLRFGNNVNMHSISFHFLTLIFIFPLVFRICPLQAEESDSLCVYVCVFQRDSVSVHSTS